MGSHPQGSEFEPLEAETRFLYTFTFRERSHLQGSHQLLQGTNANSSTEHPRWEFLSHHELYGHDLLPQFRKFLFGGDNDSCVTLRLRAGVAQSLFHNRLFVLPPGDGAEPFAAALLPPSGGIELVLSPFGAGVLSIRFRCESVAGPRAETDLPTVQRFNYALSQLRGGRFPILTLPRYCGSSQKPIDHNTGPLGATHGALNLPETILGFLEPLQAFDFRTIHEQLSIYTVVRFRATCDLAQASVRHALSPVLSSLAQVEEAQHASVPAGEMGVPCELLNRSHWAAVSSLGAAHIVCDQPNDERGRDHPFNAQRLSVVRDRYFAVYLLALLQRLALERFVSRAADLLPIDEHNSSFLVNFRALRQEVLAYSILTSTHAVTTRHALNRFYALSCLGLGLKEAAHDSIEVIEHIDECREAMQNSQVVESQTRIAKHMHDNIDRLRQMQEEVGILEMFFAAVYTTELAKIIAEGAGLEGWYAALTSVFWGVLAIFAAWLGLKRWRGKVGRLVALALLVLVIGFAWIYIGRYLSLQETSIPHSSTNSPPRGSAERPTHR